jgi:hypothetical protein
VRTAKGSFVRPAVLTGKSAADAVGARFQTAHYDWNDPLGPASYEKWRDGLKKKKISVTENSGQAYIKTDTSEGELVEASLTIAENNMRVIAGRFEFADQQWVEIAALPDVAESPVAAIPAPAPVPARQTEAEPSLRFAQTLPERELHAWALIDRLNLGAGAPVSVDARQERIVVTAYGLDPAQEQQLRDGLAGIEGVTLEVANAGDTARAAHAVDSAINTSEEIVARAHFLDQLQNQFPAATEEAFGLADRRMLWEMRSRCLSLMGLNLEALRSKLGNNWKPSGAAVSPATRELVESATLVDQLVTNLFATSNDTPARDRLTEEFNKLRAISLEYARKLGEEPSR